MVFTAVAESDGSMTLVDALPRAALGSDGTINAAEVPLYAWPTWDDPPATQIRLKPLYHALAELFTE